MTGAVSKGPAPRHQHKTTACGHTHTQYSAGDAVLCSSVDAACKCAEGRGVGGMEPKRASEQHEHTHMCSEMRSRSFINTRAMPSRRNWGATDTADTCPCQLVPEPSALPRTASTQATPPHQVEGSACSQCWGQSSPPHQPPERAIHSHSTVSRRGAVGGIHSDLVRGPQGEVVQVEAQGVLPAHIHRQKAGWC